MCCLAGCHEVKRAGSDCFNTHRVADELTLLDTLVMRRRCVSPSVPILPSKTTFGATWPWMCMSGVLASCERQDVHAALGGSEDGVCDGGADGRHAGFAHA